MRKKITCAERDTIMHATGRYDGWEVHSGLTDLDGEFGQPRVETVWGKGNQRVRDVRHPDAGGGDDVRPCEHYQWAVTEEDED